MRFPDESWIDERNVIAWIFVGIVFVLVAYAHARDHCRAAIRDGDFAYASGTTVQTTGEGALIYCHEEPVYLAIKHTAPMSALLRRYVGAVCS